MLDTRIGCPNCGKRLKSNAEIGLGDRFRCPRCEHSFRVEARDFLSATNSCQQVAAPTLLATIATEVDIGLLTAVPQPAVPSPQPPATYADITIPQPSTSPSRRKPLLIATLAVAFLFTLVVGIAIGLSRNPNDEDSENRVTKRDRKERTERKNHTERKEQASVAANEPRRGQQESQSDLGPDHFRIPAVEPRDRETADRTPPPEEKRLPEATEPDRTRFEPPAPPLRRDPVPNPEPDPIPEPMPQPDPPPAVKPIKFDIGPERQKEVDQAIARGIVHLRKAQLQHGSWRNGQHATGLAALPGLTMLECGVNPRDPAVQAALTYVRRAAPEEMMTYDISLAILFLDRYGDPRDSRLIQKLGLRLMAGQKGSGGWDYDCRYFFSPGEEIMLFDALRQTRPKDPLKLFDGDKNDRGMAFFEEAKKPGAGQTNPNDAPGKGQGVDGKGQTQPPGAAVVGTVAFGERAGLPIIGKIESNSPLAATASLENIRIPRMKLENLPQKLKELPVFQPLPAARDLPHDGRTDNSNTQFAILGIWAASRHNIPTELTLARLTKRFRVSQNNDGSWGYLFGTNGRTQGSPAMTCSGLLGLSVGHGLVAGSDPSRAKPLMEDPMIQQGLRELSNHLDPDDPAQRRKGRGGLRRALVRGEAANTYFLWSLERVGVLFNLSTIGDTDWYSWGVDILLPRQQPDGGWIGAHHNYGVSDTCLALLFLKRANLTRDLSAKMSYLRQVNELKGRKLPGVEITPDP